MTLLKTAFLPAVPFLPIVQLPVTINAAFVQVVHTQFLEVRVWRGLPKAWPRGGNPIGVARVALRSLLTTLGGIGGHVKVTSSTGEGGRAGSAAIRLFFKHRGLGASRTALDSNAALDPPPQSGEAEETRSEMSVAKRRGQDDNCTLQHTNDVLKAAAEDALCGGRDNDEALRSSRMRPLASQALGSLRTITLEPASEPRAQREATTAQSLEPWGGKLAVCVERAMRLPTIPSMALEPDAPTESLPLPSTYVTVRWEEGGKLPLRSPFCVAGSAKGNYRVASGGGNDASSVRVQQNSVLYLFLSLWSFYWAE